MPPQLIPKQELEKLLAGRVKFHAEHQEVLRTVLKTYLNGSIPVPEGSSKDAGDASVVVNWNETLDEELEAQA